MDKIQDGKMVSITYTIMDATKQVVESRELPMTYMQGGQHELFPQIADALKGKQSGDKVTINLESKDAFGAHDPGLTFTDDIKNAPEEIRYVGAKLDAESGSREVLHFRVTEIKDGKITIDSNHELAGQDLTFVVIVKEVRNPTAQELEEQSAVT